MLDKDSDEEELDRLVLGDGAGFRAQLERDMNVEEDKYEEDGESVSDAIEEGEGGLEGVDDADVKIPSKLCRLKLTSLSYSSSIPDHPLFPKAH
jgi:hypothetical protein